MRDLIEISAWCVTGTPPLPPSKLANQTATLLPIVVKKYLDRPTDIKNVLDW